MRQHLKWLLEVPRIKDFLSWGTQDRAPDLFVGKGLKLHMEGGDTPPLPMIQEAFGVGEAEARKIAQRGHAC